MLYLLTCVCGQVYAYDFVVLFIIHFFIIHWDLSRDSFLLFVLRVSSLDGMLVREIPASYIVSLVWLN